jgi:hypothetical protein
VSLPYTRIIRPMTVDDAALVSTNVAETPPAAWSSGTTYALDAQASNLVTHRIYQSVAGANLNHALTDTAWWVEVGPTNPWAMFDDMNTSQTTNADSVEVTVQTSGRVDGLALFNLSAGSVHVVSMDGATEIFNETYSLGATSGIDDWYSWFFEPIDRVTELVVPDLPVYADQTITVTIADAGATVAVGNLVIGQSRDLGMSLAGAQAGIIDYSKKVADDFGNYTISPRAFSDTLTLQVVVENDRVDQVRNLLRRYRAVPLVWVAHNDFATTQVFGFFRSFSLVFAYPTQSTCDLQIEGLTS